MDRMGRECISHHFACDCREAKFKALEAEDAKLRERLADLEQNRCDMLQDQAGLEEQQELARGENAKLSERLKLAEAVCEAADKWRKLSTRIQSPEFDMDGPGDQALFERLCLERRVARIQIKDSVKAWRQALETSDG